MSEAWPDEGVEEPPPLYPEWVEEPPDEILNPPDEEYTETPDPVSTTGVTEVFPLREGDLFGTIATAPQVHCGYTLTEREDDPETEEVEGDIVTLIPEENGWIGLIQAQTGAEITGVYDEQTASAVTAWRAKHGLQDDGDEDYVDEKAWTAMMRFEEDEDQFVNDQTMPEE